MQHSLSWKTNSRSVDKEIFRPLWKPEDNYSIHVALRRCAVTTDSQPRQFGAKCRRFAGRFYLHHLQHTRFNTVFTPHSTELCPQPNESINVLKLSFYKANIWSTYNRVLIPKYFSKHNFVSLSPKILLTAVPVRTKLPQCSTALPLLWKLNDVRDALLRSRNVMSLSCTRY